MSECKACPLSDKLLPLGTGLLTLGLSLMVGGMLALGAFTAPVVFGQLGRLQGAPLMAVIFRGYDVVLQVALVVVLIGEALRIASGRFVLNSRLAITRFSLLALLAIGIAFSTLVVNADIERMNREGLRRDHSVMGRKFERVHRLSENLYKLEMLDAIVLLLLTPFMLAAARPGKANDA